MKNIPVKSAELRVSDDGSVWVSFKIDEETAKKNRELLTDAKVSVNFEIV